jgi:hypothetical protein
MPLAAIVVRRTKTEMDITMTKRSIWWCLDRE